MAKLGTDPISEVDLLEFLVDCSDFAFEVQVLRELIGRGFTCEHGGTYDDPATGKPREFDIRATRGFGRRVLRLAVECKNLRENFPLLISCLPRRIDEAFEDLIYSAGAVSQSAQPSADLVDSAAHSHARIVRLPYNHSRYRTRESVGKSCDQVGRTAASGEIKGGDSGVYQKWAQALSSSDDLVRITCSGKHNAISQVFPLVVVPNGRLWQVDYDATGTRKSEPCNVDHVSYFVGKSYSHPRSKGDHDYTISHIEFVTMDGMMNFVQSYWHHEFDHFLFNIIQESIRAKGA